MKDNDTKIKKKTSIGGQALLEGIMMRGPQKTALAVRQPDGNIELEVSDTVISTKKGFTKWPVVRGVFGFVDSMISGYRALMRSAELSGLEELLEEEEREKEAKKKAKAAASAKTDTTAADTAQSGNTADDIPADTAASAGVVQTVAEPTVDAPADAEPTAAEPAAAEPETGAESANVTAESPEKAGKKKSNGTMTAVMIVSVILGVALALFLFKVIPETLYELLTRAFPSLTGEGYGYSLLRAAFTGVIKIAILVGYMSAVSLMKDIKRTFMYHGAEHKTIFCYEKGLELNVDNVRAQRRFHPRCGTSFLILMMLVSIFVTMFIPSQLIANRVLNVVIRSGIGILLLPFIMGIGYELIKFAGRHDNALTRVISAPGVWLQHITTKEPTDDMIECAIAALREVIPPDDSDKW